VKDKELELIKQQEILGEFDPNDYETERVLVRARDGAEVPLSIVYKKGFKKNGKAPLLLYGYGSYGYSMEPYFSSVRLSLLNRGFAFAIAHVRGGEEMGRHWYESGKLKQKKNTFLDFIDCAEFLINNKFTSEDHLYAMGGSAGGLLVGAVINMRADLFFGAIAAVPFVDVLTTMLDESIPLTTGEYDEWGNPNKKEYYDYIKSYSPYDNVIEQAYPALLVTTGLHDSQVQYWEPAKWVAKLRDHHTGKAPILMHTDMSTGHGGKAGRYERFKETAMEYAFLLDLEGIAE
jgi:oligopeptidase B